MSRRRPPPSPLGFQATICAGQQQHVPLDVTSNQAYLFRGNKDRRKVMNPETGRKVEEAKSAGPAEDLMDLGSVTEDTKGHTLGRYYDGGHGFWV